MSLGRIQGLDGLRAFSIAAVMMSHLCGTYFLPMAGVRTVGVFGEFGVEVFFVISGFIITWLLLNEEIKLGQISLRNFYLGRSLRILPPALIYILAVFMLTMAGIADAPGRDLLAAAFFVRNFIPAGSQSTGHYWTLAMEEQFYLVWPFCMFLLRPNKLRLIFAAGLLVAAPFWRQFNYVMAGAAANVNMHRTDMRYDALIIGCTLALLRFDRTWLKSSVIDFS